MHGRGARREETIRALAPLLAEGWTCLVPTYRNDEGVPAGPDGRYALGLSEWRDIDAAMGYALARGADELLLAGWSMGGAIVLQALDRSAHADAVGRVVLDGRSSTGATSSRTTRTSTTSHRRSARSRAC